MTFFRIAFKSSNYSYHSRRKSTFFATPEVVSEFSAAWCLSIAGSISFDVCLRKRNSCDDEKELKKANLHASNGIFVNFGSGNILFKPLVRL